MTFALTSVIARQEAKQFYAAGFEEGKGLMPPEAFKSVDWDTLKLLLFCKPKNVQYIVQQVMLGVVRGGTEVSGMGKIR